MPLDTSTKRRSSVGLWQVWQTAPPSPTDSPGALDTADRAHGAYSYSGIAAAEPGENGHVILFRPHYRPRRR